MDLATGIGIAAGAATAFGGAMKYVVIPVKNAVSKIGGTFEKVSAMSDALQLDPETGRSAVVETVGRIDKALGPNGGGSLVDKVDRIEEQGKQNAEQGQRSNEVLEIVSGAVQQVANQIDRPLYQASADGLLTRQNEKFSKLVGYGPEQMLGMGWLQLLPEADKDRVLKEIGWARRDRRRYRIRTTLNIAGGGQLDVELSAQPGIGGPSGPVLAWFGTVDVLKVIAEPRIA